MAAVPYRAEPLALHQVVAIFGEEIDHVDVSVCDLNKVVGLLYSRAVDSCNYAFIREDVAEIIPVECLIPKN